MNGNLRIVSFMTVLLCCSCAQLIGIEETSEEPYDPFERRFAGESTAWASSDECPLIIAYVSEWSVDKSAFSLAASGFMVYINQTDWWFDLDTFEVDYISSTEEIDLEVSFGDMSPLLLGPGESVGRLSPGAKDILEDYIHLPSREQETLGLVLRIDPDHSRNVSVEIELLGALGLTSVVIPLQFRFLFRESNQPIEGKYACAMYL